MEALRLPTSTCEQIERVLSYSMEINRQLRYVRKRVGVAPTIWRATVDYQVLQAEIDRGWKNLCNVHTLDLERAMIACLELRAKYLAPILELRFMGRDLIVAIDKDVNQILGILNLRVLSQRTKLQLVGSDKTGTED